MAKPIQPHADPHEAADQPTDAEIYRAYCKARLRYQRISFLKALSDPLLYKQLQLQALAARKPKQHGKPAPILQAA